ncbi:(2Fe-2S)-binding protein [Kibdelosporangium aridum]|uniref:Carbon-monoxide dehydrogenase small subunit n=1 Tax=Kibdelosporangium aridum TaxID=2030 RepID=A0A1Y5WUI2_KIBAR|nr:(2Fe-2S)-binding protein [Kibdelosporangium aridum]SMC47199.1 carbon-monoxide dehydrogenase small subunit [Kibdelosporangium aridum]
MKQITLTVNGTPHRVTVDDSTLLLDALREQVGCFSVREGCGVGACGACTVLADGMSVSSCLALALRYEGAEITTVEGLGENDHVVNAFVDCDAAQCGYCIPGFVLMSHELLRENPKPTEEQITDHLEGNICRCGTYPEIRKAVATAADRKVGE